MENNGDFNSDEPAAVAATGDSAVPSQSAPSQSAPSGDDGSNLSSLGSDPAHPFDQTNGIVEGLEGDDDGRVDDDGDALGVDPTLAEDQVRDRPDEDGRT